LISLLDDKGRPSETERVFVLPPGSQLGPVSAEQRQALMAGSLVAGVYEKTIDRESAYEKIKGRAPAMDAQAVQQARQTVQNAQTENTQTSDGGVMGQVSDLLFGTTGPRGGHRDGVAQLVVRSAVRTVGSAIGREIVRGVLGGLLGGGGRRR
jgi:hypothetical protein